MTARDERAHRLPRELPFDPITCVMFVLTVTAMLVWGFLSVFWFAEACSVYATEAWIPAVATTGTMLVASSLARLDNLTTATRFEAWSLAALGVTGDVIITAVQHYLAVISSDPRAIHPGPLWGGVLGGIPSLMVGFLVHVGILAWRDCKQAAASAERERLQALEEAARRDREQDQLDRAARRDALLIREQRDAAALEIRSNEARAQVLTREVDLETVRRLAAEAETERLRQQTALAQAQLEAKVAPLGSGQPEGHTNGRPPSATITARPVPDAAKIDNGAPDAPDVTDLLAAGHEIADELRLTNTKITRDAVLKRLRARGLPCSNSRAGELVRQLQDETRTRPAPSRTVQGRADGRHLQRV